MSSKFHIRHVPHKEIDFTKWDNCISTAPNGLIYGYSYYLDHMAKQWDGLVLNDYEAVMPLIWDKKYGILYCYQPPFIQQCGWFGSPLTMHTCSTLFERIRSFCRYGDFMFNSHNQLINESYITRPLTNFVLDLSHGYSAIRSRYKTDLLSNLNKAAKLSLSYQTSVEIDSAVNQYRFHYGARTPHVKQNHYRHFSQLCKQLIPMGQCLIREISDEQHYTLASILLLKDQHRIYNIMNTTTEKGKKAAANHFLIDKVLQEFAGQNLLFDFEGSDLPGVKSFYENFGPVNYPYFHWHYNRLPFYLKWLKK